MTHEAAGTRPGIPEQLSAEGVSVWLDGVCRGLLVSGGLEHMVCHGAVKGATTNPAPLVEAVTDHPSYLEQLAQLADRGATPAEAARAVLAYDVRWACDILRPIHAATDGREGHVSVDLAPALAHDPRATLAEARAFSRLVNRRNVLIKIPATDAGLAAISDCLAEGISVHATTLYSVHRYGEVIDAYFDGLERAHAAGLALSTITSLAGLPVGELDAEVDARLDLLGAADTTGLRSATALASARLAYHLYEERLGSERWRRLSLAGARPQRLMWTSSTILDQCAGPGTDGSRTTTRYVDGLVAWGTVNALTQEALAAATRHCELQGDTMTGEHAAATWVMARLTDAGIDYDSLVQELMRGSLDRLLGVWRELLSTIEDALPVLVGTTGDPATL